MSPLFKKEPSSYPDDMNQEKPTWGLVQVFTGNGKGKTTASLGTAIRAAAKGKRVAIVYFDKGGETHYSERELIRQRIPEIELFPTGLDRIDPVTNKFRFGVTSEDQTEGQRGLEIVKDLLQRNEHALLILDEINSSTELGIINETAVLALLDQKPKDMEMILTGRNAPASFKERADLVTEMTLEKHYFYNGVMAREGIDY